MEYFTEHCRLQTQPGRMSRWPGCSRSRRGRRPPLPDLCSPLHQGQLGAPDNFGYSQRAARVTTANTGSHVRGETAAPGCSPEPRTRRGAHRGSTPDTRHPTRVRPVPRVGRSPKGLTHSCAAPRGNARIMTAAKRELRPPLTQRPPGTRGPARPPAPPGSNEGPYRLLPKMQPHHEGSSGARNLLA